MFDTKKSISLIPFWIASVCLALFLSNCNSAKPFDYSQTVEYSIPESNVAFVIPKEYFQMTLKEYKILLDSSDYSDEFKLNQNLVLSKMESRFPTLDLLVATITYENLIMVLRSAPHIELDRRTANLALDMFTENNTKNDLIIQDEILVENQLIYMNWYRYIKLKIKQDYIHGERAITHYLISTDNKTLVILNGNWFGTICAYLFWLLSRRETQSMP